MWRRWGTASAIALVACGSVVAGCGDDPASSPLNQGADDQSGPVAGLLPPGAPLSDEFEVRPGSRLVGASFPYKVGRFGDRTAEDEGAWQALIVVDGDPLEVWDRYAELLGVADWAASGRACIVRRVELPRLQATATTRPDQTTTTLSAGGAPFVPPSTLVPVEPSPVLEFPVTERLLTDAAIDEENQVRCHAASAHLTMSMRFGVEVRCSYDEVDPYDPDCAFWRDRHLYVNSAPNRIPFDASVADVREVKSTGLRVSRGLYGEMPQPVSADQIARPRLDDDGATSMRPGPGERLDAELDGYLGRTKAAIVPDGAESVVAPALVIECNSGLTTVLRMAVGPEAAVRAFDDADEMDDPMEGIVPLDQGEWLGRAWVHGQITTAGGYYLDLTAVADGADASFVLLTECGD